MSDHGTRAPLRQWHVPAPPSAVLHPHITPTHICTIPRNFQQVHATEAEARVHSSRLGALQEEANLEKRQEEARELRERHAQAVAILNEEMKEKKRLAWEGVAAKIEAR